MYQPLKFNACSSYTKHYTPKFVQGSSDAADLKDSMQMRPDMVRAFSTCLHERYAASSEPGLMCLQLCNTVHVSTFFGDLMKSIGWTSYTKHLEPPL